MCARRTHVIAHLVVHTHQITKKSSCIILVAYLSVVHVHPSCTTQSHVTHSATCKIVWFHQDSRSRHPVGVPGNHKRLGATHQVEGQICNLDQTG